MSVVRETSAAMGQGTLHEQFGKLNAARTPGRWEAVDQKRGHHQFQFVRALDVVVENRNGPSYCQEIFADDSYDTKVADQKFAAWCANNAADIFTALRCSHAIMQEKMATLTPINVTTRLGGTTDADLLDRARDEIANGGEP